MHGRLLPQVPVPQGLVPAPRHQHVHLLDPRHVPDRRVVPRHLLLRVAPQVPHLRLVVAAPGEDLGPVARPAAGEGRLLVGVRRLADRLPVRLHLPRPHLVVPARPHQQVRLGAEAHARDALRQRRRHLRRTVSAPPAPPPTWDGRERIAAPRGAGLGASPACTREIAPAKGLGGGKGGAPVIRGAVGSWEGPGGCRGRPWGAFLPRSAPSRKRERERENPPAPRCRGGGAPRGRTSKSRLGLCGGAAGRKADMARAGPEPAPRGAGRPGAGAGAGAPGGRARGAARLELL